MINWKIFAKDISFMFLPTVSVLSLILIGFFSWTKFVVFITSDSGWAVFLRIVLAILEIVFVYLMYQYYLKQEIINNGVTNKGNIITNIKNDYTYEYKYFKNRDRIPGESYRSYSTANDNIIVLERFKQN